MKVSYYGTLTFGEAYLIDDRVQSCMIILIRFF